MTLKFDYTESAKLYEAEVAPNCDPEIMVCHVFRDIEGRRCTAFYPVSNYGQAEVLVDALNRSKKDEE